MAVEERNNKLRSSVSFIDSISTGLRTFTRKRHHSIPALEHENIPRNVSAFPNSVISTELTEQNNADYDIIVDDAPKTTRKKKTKLQTVNLSWEIMRYCMICEYIQTSCFLALPYEL